MEKSRAFLWCFFLSVIFWGNMANAQVSYIDFSAKQQCFNSSDGIMTYTDEGEGEPIVLLHGVPTSSWVFRKMIPELVAAGFRVIAPDMLGFGNSTAPVGKGLYTPESHALRLLELLDYLKIEEWNQVVHDAGSVWINPILEKQPERISKLVLLNSVLTGEGVNWEEQIGVGLQTKLGLTLQQMGLQKTSFVSRFVANSLVVNKITRQLSEGYEAPMLEKKTEATYAHYRHMAKVISEDQLDVAGFEGPTAVIWGRKDIVLTWNPQQEAVMNKMNIRTENIHILEGGHLIPEENAKEVDALIIGFLAPK